MRHQLTVFLGLALVLPLLACSNSTEPLPTGSVMLEFSHRVGDHPLVMNSMTNVNAAGNVYSVETLMYYVSDVTFSGPDGSHTEAVVHYVDAEDEDTHTLMIPGIPERHYETISFTYGLSPERNQTGALGTDQVNLNMAWPENWGGGYHYMKLEGHFEVEGSNPSNYLSHTGRYKDPEGVEHPHDFRVSVTPHFNVVRDVTAHVELKFDVNQWYENPNVINLESHATGIMANTAAQDLMEANGESVFSLGHVTGGGDHEDE